MEKFAYHFFCKEDGRFVLIRHIIAEKILETNPWKAVATKGTGQAQQPPLAAFGRLSVW